MSSASCSNWLQTRLLIPFIALLTIGSPKDFVFQAFNLPCINENLMFSQLIRKQLLSSSFHARNRFTSPPSGNGWFNALDRIFATSETASYQKPPRTACKLLYLAETSFMSTFKAALLPTDHLPCRRTRLYS